MYVSSCDLRLFVGCGLVCGWPKKEAGTSWKSGHCEIAIGSGCESAIYDTNMLSLKLN